MALFDGERQSDHIKSKLGRIVQIDRSRVLGEHNQPVREKHDTNNISGDHWGAFFWLGAKRIYNDS